MVVSGRIGQRVLFKPEDREVMTTQVMLESATSCSVEDSAS